MVLGRDLVARGRGLSNGKSPAAAARLSKNRGELSTIFAEAPGDSRGAPAFAADNLRGGAKGSGLCSNWKAP
jgi:hypothetical protein